jgi:predicted permease
VQSIPREIVGVMPNFQLPRRDPEVILPLQFDRGKVFLGNFAYVGIARLKPGVSLDLGNADIGRMIPIWMDSWPNPMGPNKTVWINARLGPKLHRLKDDYLGTVANTLWLVMATVALVLLIACANVANLLLVRAESRQQEWGVRAALGAGRARIVVDSLAESLLLGLTAGAAGVALAYAGVALLKYVQLPGLPRLAEVSVDTTVVAFALVTSIAAGLLFGSIPTLKYAGSRLAQTLRSGGRTASSSRERHRFQGSLVIAQVALALVLLVISGLMIRTFAEQRKVQPGFTNPEMVQTFRIVIPSAQIPEQERVIRMENDIVDKLAAIPGVTNVGFGTSVPMDFNLSNDAILVEGKDYGPSVNPPPRRYKYISPGFLKSTGTRLIAGREQSWSDIYAQRNFAMVSENLAKELWGSPQAALGKHIRDTPVNAWWEVIGVVEDVHDEGVVKKAPAIVYWPIASAQFFGQPKMVQRAVVYAVRGKGVGTEGLLNQIRQAVWSVNSSIPLAQIRTFKDIYEQSMAQTSFAMAILSIAAGMALLLGMVGIYGVIAYTVTQRKREVGIRMALGAQAAQVKRMFLGNGLALSSLGIAAGLLAAAAVSRLMAGLLFGVRPIDPLTYAATSATLLLATAAACYIPARRAAKVDPAETLRNE